MDTRTAILETADQLIRLKGYNAFSYKDVADKLGIKTASIHYHFPTKTQLGLAVIEEQSRALEEIMQTTAHKSALSQLKAFLSIYSNAKSDNKICIVGSMGSDFNTFEPVLCERLKQLAADILGWVSSFLEKGKKNGEFHFEHTPRVQALLMITNMLAALQLTRLTNDSDFNLIKQTIIKDLTK